MANSYIDKLLDKLADKLLPIVIKGLISELDNYSNEQKTNPHNENQSESSVSLDLSAFSQEYQHTTAKGFELDEQGHCSEFRPTQPNSVCKK